MRRLALLALAGTLACGEDLPELQAGPLDAFTFPTGLGVLDHRLVVVSSNADLTYESETGGSVISANVCEPAVPPDPQICTADTVAGALNVESFAGELGVANPAACPALAAAGKGAAVVVPIRGTNVVYRFAVDAAGALSCDGCEIPVGSGERGDPFSVGIACGPGIARAYVGYLRSSSGNAWLSEIDLTKDPGADGYVRHRLFQETGQYRGFAYDAARSRLYLTRAAAAGAPQIRWVDLAGECRIDVPEQDGGCRTSSTLAGSIPSELELRAIALANEPSSGGAVRRAYLTARLKDPTTGASNLDGLLVVGDLSEDLAGRLQLTIVDRIPIGYGAGDVRVLPPRAGKRDVVAALAGDDGVLWIYDDDTGGRVAIGRDPGTGAPTVGRGPFPLAVDPDPLAGVARVYVGSFREYFVTPVDVPLAAPETAHIVTASDGKLRRVGPQVTQVTP
jgi:hypothetical protein